jgi:uncharacterized protein YxjI
LLFRGLVFARMDNGCGYGTCTQVRKKSTNISRKWKFILERVPRQPLRVHGAVKRAGMEHRVTHERNIVARVMEASEDDSVVRINLVREDE